MALFYQAQAFNSPFVYMREDKAYKIIRMLKFTALKHNIEKKNKKVVSFS